MSGKKRTRIVLFGLIGLVVLLVLIDSIGVFDTRSYYEVPHGNHTHYLPKDCDPPLPVSNGASVRPAAGEKINCQGQIVPE